MSSMRSASSSTSVFRASSVRYSRARWSITRPGVPTTICAPCSSEARWPRSATPPHKVTTLMFSSARARRRISVVTWSASSRVGHSTRACTAKRRGFRLVSSASAKAAVLPLPVWAWAIRSLPASAAGRLAAWIGVIAW